MQIEKYELKADETLTTFDFISHGLKGAIHKQIQFQPTEEKRIFNLAFGDFNLLTGDIDDLVISANNDTEKVLATVVSALYAFFFQHPEALVYAAGSTQARTRLYRMGITRNFEVMQKDFYLLGQIGDDFMEFEKGVHYDGFLVQQKFY